MPLAEMLRSSAPNQRGIELVDWPLKRRVGGVDVHLPRLSSGD
jgi:hypothetical protein